MSSKDVHLIKDQKITWLVREGLEHLLNACEVVTRKMKAIIDDKDWGTRRLEKVSMEIGVATADIAPILK